ncbi:hypothetical protein [Streptomyces smyrnaeus]|uniref:hypothetical protein n=1 Tax=Streptomyces smyrnaeus TaxID=1387713 RepID=UPI0036C9789D
MLEAVGSELVSALVAAALTGLMGLARWLLARRLPARRIWRFEKAAELSTVVDTDHVDTGRYRRPVSGLGQVRALSLLVPSLHLAYRDLDLEKLHLSAHLPGSALEGDLLVLGGPKTNETAGRLLTAMADSLPFRTGSGRIVWDGTPYEGDAADGAVTRDLGLVIRAPNPFNPAARVVLLCGWSTYGTLAAARWLTTEGADRSLPADLTALVESHVLPDGHVSPPRVLRLSR